MNLDSRISPLHGGDDLRARRWPAAPKPVLDLSTGINPFSYPFKTPQEPSWHRLPQSDAEAQVKRALAGYLGITNTDTVVLAPGSQILINQLPLLFSAGDVSICEPTYGEHASSWLRAGHHVSELKNLGGPPNKNAFVVVTNPNNPDGRQIDRTALREMAASIAGNDRFLIVDEAFADLTPDISVAALVEELPIVVLRSFGKFFGLAGVRLGAMIARPDLCSRMADRLGPWCVSGPTLEIARQAYENAAWAANMRQRLEDAAAQLDRLLCESGLNVIGGTDLFRLIEHPKAGSIYEDLGARGILVRPFDYNPKWLRFGLPPNEATTTRLANALREVMCDV